jgi:thiol:disulfide interchange protein
VRAKLKEINAVALVGDYTHFADAITTELNRYNRAGVPLVLVFRKPGRTGHHSAADFDAGQLSWTRSTARPNKPVVAW